MFGLGSTAMATEENRGCDDPQHGRQALFDIDHELNPRRFNSDV